MLHAFTLGSGDSIFSDILPSIAQAQFEVLFVTCFWAKSSSLDRVSSCLRNLSKRALERESKVRVRICLSSLSLLQKLYHTSSPAGRTYSPSVWVKKFGLPPPEDLRGLDLEIKSVFIRPFSVMHPKFIVIDRKYLYLPSCNVSWENWLEGCLQASGPLVNHFVNFWQDFWANDVDKRSSSSTVSQEVDVSAPEFHRTVSQPSLSRPFASTVGCKKVLLDLANAETAFLLSPHHANPRFRPFPWQPAIPPPQTPLNTFLLHAFDNAASKIYIQTPNITSPPVLKALLVALKRGVNIHIVTSERLMLLEQLVTAGTTTVRCLRRLKDQHQQLHAERQKPLLDEEQGPNQSLGSLRIEFFVKGFSDAQLQLSPEPVQSHLKLTVVDNQTIVFGSGNMDRASWFTSQELGVAIVSPSLAGSVMRSLEECLASRTKLDFDG
ncbi:MAG: hypothetical protein M1822_000396 [Bathelium mastoideum]|nr:MAG: hypothetical protein M1822_000396 [Bathelium mastoideum]